MARPAREPRTGAKEECGGVQRLARQLGAVAATEEGSVGEDPRRVRGKKVVAMHAKVPTEEIAIAVGATLSDDDPLACAHALIADDRLLQAARVLSEAGIVAFTDAAGSDASDSGRRHSWGATSDLNTTAPAPASTPSVYQSAASTDAKLVRYMRKAALMQELIDSLKSAPSAANGWTVQGEHLGARDISIYYRMVGRCSGLNPRG